MEQLECRKLLAAATSFSFSLDGSYSTSAGVYDASDVLVRTLWSGERLGAGSYNRTWDGNRDDGSAAPNGASYTVKVLTANMQYVWQGAIGNSSTSATGSTIWAGLNVIPDMAFSGSTGFASPGFVEGPPGLRKFSTSDPNTSVGAIAGDSWVHWGNVATDGTRYYVSNVGSGLDKHNNTFVAAYNVSDMTPAAFSAGVNVTPAGGSIAYAGVIDLAQKITSPTAVDAGFRAEQSATGLAVQSGGNVLAVSHGGLNTIRLFNKTTGASLGSISITAPGRVAFAANGDLWVISGTTAKRFDASTLGSTNTPVTTIGGFSNPLAIAAHPSDNDVVLVADGGTSQQVKAYTRNGTSLWTYGQAGGYASDPTVANDKLWFAHPSGLGGTGSIAQTFVAIQSDGSFWVGDPGNNRALHFSASRTYINQISYIPSNYVIEVDPNDATRVFANYLEYRVDYNVAPTPGDPSSGTGGNWTLVKNWAGGIDTSALQSMRSVITLTAGGNAFTYALVAPKTTQNWVLLKLPSSGPAQVVSSNVPVPFGNGAYYTAGIGTNGDQRWAKEDSANSQGIYRRSLVSIDASGNLTWGSETKIASVPNSSNDPHMAPTINNNPISIGITTSNKVITYNGGNAPAVGSYHLGAAAIGGTSYLWKTLRAANITYPDDQGTYPTQNSYGGHAGTAVYVEGNNIIANYDGQYGTFSNQFWHYHENGLFVGQFGTTQRAIGDAAWGYSGNYGSVQLARGPNGALYAYTGDETGHSGISVWAITGDKELRTFQATGLDGTTLALADPNASIGTGLRADYYADPGNGTRFNTPIISRTDSAVDFNWSSSSQTKLGGSNFSARWQGQISPRYSQTYTFSTVSAGGVRLWIDGQLVIDHWTAHGSTTNTGTITLNANQKYDLRLEYYNTTYSGAVQLKWQSSSQALEVVPTERLFAPKGALPLGFHSGQPYKSLGAGDNSTYAAIDNSTSAGKKMNYFVNVAEGGEYNVIIRALATGSGGSVHLEDMYGNNLSGSVRITNTGGNEWLFRAPVTLKAGLQRLTLVQESGGYDLRSITFNRRTTPFTNTAYPDPITLPATNGASATVQAENFDLGGWGVGGFNSDGVNRGNAKSYRPEGFNIYNGQTTPTVRDLRATDYLKYSVNVPAGGGTYSIAVRYRRPNNVDPVSLHFEDEIGNNVSGAITLPDNPSDGQLGSASFTLAMPAGLRTLKMVVDVGVLYLFDYMTFTNAGIATVPAAPSGLSATAASATQVNLAWTVNSHNETGFKIDRATNSNFTNGLTTITVAATASTYSDTGLTTGTTYYYRVRAINSAGESSNSSAANATPQATGGVPSAPSGLSATAISTSQINLAWTDNSSNETGFKVERATDSAFTQNVTLLTTAAANATSYNDTGLSASTTYYYRVRATNASGDSANTSVANATTQTPSGQQASIGVNFLGQDGASATITSLAGYVPQLNWNGMSGSSQSTGQSLVLADGTLSGATITWNASARWHAFNGVNASTPGNGQLLSNYLDHNTNTGTNTVTISNLPTSITSGGYQVIVYMNGDTAGRGGYYTLNGGTPMLLQVASGGSSSTNPTLSLASASTPGNYYVFTNLTGSTMTLTATPYSGFSGGGANRAPINGIQIVSLASSTAPDAPSGLTATAISGTQVNLGWADNSSNESGFKVERATDSAFTQNVALVTTTAANVTAYSNTGLTAGTTYYYRVRATNAVGDSANTSVVSVTTPSASTKLTGTVIGTTGSYNNLGNTRDKAFDGDLNTFFDGPLSNGQWVGLDLGVAQSISMIKYAPRAGLASRMVGGIFQASNTADFSSGVVDIYTITSTPTQGVLTSVSVTTSAYQYYRYLSPIGGCGNVAEIEFWS